MTFTIASVSWANNWSWISKNVNDRFYIDESTLKISGNIVKFGRWLIIQLLKS